MRGYLWGALVFLPFAFGALAVVGDRMSIWRLFAVIALVIFGSNLADMVEEKFNR